jgi:hypothetical protein
MPRDVIEILSDLEIDLVYTRSFQLVEDGFFRFDQAASKNGAILPAAFRWRNDRGRSHSWFQGDAGNEDQAQAQYGNKNSSHQVTPSK